MSKYVYSTLTAPVEYALWKRGGGDLPTIKKSVRIEGGANIASKHFVTSRGVLTVISDEDFEILQQDPVFQKHQKRGFIMVEDKEAPSIEAAASIMESQDESAPLTPNDFDGETGPQPVETEDKPSKSKRK